MSSFIEIIRLAATSPDNDVRKNSEQKLIEYRTKEPANFFKDCITHIGDEATDAGLKRAICSIVKASITSEVFPGQGIWWFTLSKEAKTEIRRVCLHILASPHETIRNAAADLTSTVFVLDFPTKDWPDLLKKLYNDAISKNVEFQKVAITTIGYICEKLATNKLQPNSEEIDTIMAGIATGLSDEQTNEEIRLASIKGLLDSIPFFKDLLKQEGVREHFLTLILKNCAHTNEEIVLKSVQCLIDIFKGCYPYLSARYMDVILDATVKLMKKPSASIVIANVEFWNSVARYEAKLQFKQALGEESGVAFYNFTNTYAKPVTICLLENLMKKDNEDVESGLSVHSASIECLAHINSLGFENNKEVNIQFISGQIGSDNEKCKVAALQCFQAMISGGETKANALIEASFSNILPFLSGSKSLCKATLKLIEAISAVYPKFMLNDAICKSWLEPLVNLLAADLEYCPNICRILERVGDAAFKLQLVQTLFASKSVDLIKILIELCFVKTNSSNMFIINECTVASIGLSKCVSSVPMMNTLLDFLNKCLANTHNLSGEIKNSIKESLYTIIMTCIYILKRLNSTVKGTEGEGAIQSIYLISQTECNNEGSNFSQALSVLVAISCMLKTGIDAEKITQLCGYISKALKNLQHEELVKSGLEAVGDLLRNFPEVMAPHVGGLLEFMVNTLKDPSLSFELRVCIYNTFSDIAISCPSEVKARLDNILQLYLFAFDAVVSLLNSNVDPDKLEYAIQIKNSSIESFFYLIHGIVDGDGPKDADSIQKLGQFMKPLGIFLMNTLDEKSNPSEFYITTVLGLLCVLAESKIMTGTNFDGKVYQVYKNRVSLINKSKNKYNSLLDRAQAIFGV